MTASNTDQFVHLHVHTEYSMLDGAARVPELLAEAARMGMPAIAMTDHGNVFGAYDFYAKAKAAGIKPIIGDGGLPDARHLAPERTGCAGPRVARTTSPVAARTRT